VGVWLVSLFPPAAGSVLPGRGSLSSIALWNSVMPWSCGREARCAETANQTWAGSYCFDRWPNVEIKTNPATVLGFFLKVEAGACM